MDLQGTKRADDVCGPRHHVRYDRPDPAREPQAYMDWLLDFQLFSGKKGEKVAEKLEPIELPFVEDIYTIGPKAAPADEKKWFVVVTEPQQERRVADELTRDGIETYVPLRKAYRRAARASRRAVMTRPLLPGYAFAGLPGLAGGISCLMAADGAMWVLPRPDAPRSVPTDEIERLRKMEDAGEFDETQANLRKGWNKAKPTGTLSWICKGARILVTDGPFAGYHATIEAVDAGRRRVKAPVSIFGRATPLELEYAQFRKT